MADTLTDEAGRICALRQLSMVPPEASDPFEPIMALAKRFLGTPIVAVTLIDEEEQQYHSAIGLDAAACPKQESACRVTIAQRDVLAIEDTRTDPRFAGSTLVTGPPYMVAYAGAPLTLPDGYQIGALCVIDHKPRIFSDKEKATLRDLAACVVREIELRREAERDDLTTLLRRGPFFERVGEVLEQARTTGDSAVLAVMDLDHFKSINDRYGHAGGDGVIASTANILRACAGPHTILGRVGGEEFGLCLAGADMEEAFARLDGMRSTLGAHTFDATHGDRVTASFGFALFRADIDDVTTWYKMADEALYRAKEAGRNTVLCTNVLPTTGALARPHTLPFLDRMHVRSANQPATVDADGAAPIAFSDQSRCPKPKDSLAE